ncbi:hypothetical protein EYZ11_013544 [Aspergillus tanneri]|uniref:Uncharacterized protein n=1 Tax=Aspergillus tanneri TaxID=1220188 RepID=A0A4S3IXD9_9EURO|nr:hypothetical protein EYZ11_013544 [Aspergillus tanneri]
MATIPPGIDAIDRYLSLTAYVTMAIY